ncbi:MAG: phosphohistidine phosphatase SixA [Planctomycetota bacterium]
MIVYLLRHGEAEGIGSTAARTDADRQLTSEGRQRLQQAKHAWRRCVGSVDRVYASTLVRAKQTSTEFARALDYAGTIEIADWLTPEADPDLAVRHALAEAAAGRDSIAFVGHQPHLGDVLGRLLVGHGSIPLKKGMLVGVELDGPASASGHLVCCLSAKIAGRLDA